MPVEAAPLQAGGLSSFWTAGLPNSLFLFAGVRSGMRTVSLVFAGILDDLGIRRQRLAARPDGRGRRLPASPNLPADTGRRRNSLRLIPGRIPLRLGSAQPARNGGSAWRAATISSGVFPKFLHHLRMQAGERCKRPAGLTTPLRDAIPPHIRQETSETQH